MSDSEHRIKISIKTTPERETQAPLLPQIQKATPVTPPALKKSDVKKDAPKRMKLPFSKKDRPAGPQTPAIGYGTKETKKRRSRLFVFGSYSTKDLVHFAKRLAFLIRSGIPILESLHLLQKQTKAKSKKKILEVVIDDVSNGRPLSSGLARFKESFGDFAINVIRVGEMSGSLSNNLVYLSEELQKRYALRRKVIGALVYPAFITLATIGISTLLTVYIFPKVMPIFASLNVSLPFTTVTLLFISNFLRHWGIYTLIGLIIAAAGFFFLLRANKTFRYFVARTILRVPLLGRLVQDYNMANFSRTLSLLLRSGFNVVEAATVTSDSTANPVYKEECIELRERIVKGERISTYLETEPKLFPDIVCHMISIGEASGTLSDSLMYLSEHYEAEVDDAVKNLSSSIEPVLMIFMGLIVGFVAVSVITPIYEITQHLSR